MRTDELETERVVIKRKGAEDGSQIVLEVDVDGEPYISVTDIEGNEAVLNFSDLQEIEHLKDKIEAIDGHVEDIDESLNAIEEATAPEVLRGEIRTNLTYDSESYSKPLIDNLQKYLDKCIVMYLDVYGIKARVLGGE